MTDGRRQAEGDGRTGLADSTFLAEVQADADALGERMRRECRAMPDPAATSMFDQLYADAHPVVDRERAWLATYLAGFAAAEQGH